MGHAHPTRQLAQPPRLYLTHRHSLRRLCCTLPPPALDPTLTLNAAEFDTDPNTEQSLDVSAGSLARKSPSRRSVKIGLAAALLGLTALAGAFVIRIQTDEGEVVIESEFDGVSVDILRDGQPVKKDWQLRSGDDNRWVVRSGTVTVKLPADLRGEFSIEQDTATLVRDGTILVKITRKKKPDAATVATEDPNRAVAEWALEHGATIAIVSPPGTPAFYVTSVEQLRPGKKSATSAIGTLDYYNDLMYNTRWRLRWSKLHCFFQHEGVRDA